MKTKMQTKLTHQSLPILFEVLRHLEFLKHYPNHAYGHANEHKSGEGRNLEFFECEARMCSNKIEGFVH